MEPCMNKFMNDINNFDTDIINVSPNRFECFSLLLPSYFSVTLRLQANTYKLNFNQIE